MCRLLAYKGPPVILNDLLYKPEHSIIKQSYHAQEMDEPLNGDGFGIGWYAREIDSEPAIFTSVRPAWNNRNLQYLAPKISSGCVFAHVRAASVGSVTSLNCHPFHCHDFLMMHNGSINGFKEIRRPLLAKLSDEYFHAVKGQTDSEHFFALFMHHLAALPNQKELSTCIAALQAAVKDVDELRLKLNVAEPSRLNLLITDGDRFVGSRLVLGKGKPLSLYYAQGSRFECRDHKYSLQESEHPSDNKAVLIASERLSSNAQHWKKVPANHYFSVDQEGEIEFIAA